MLRSGIRILKQQLLNQYVHLATIPEEDSTNVVTVEVPEPYQLLWQRRLPYNAEFDSRKFTFLVKHSGTCPAPTKVPSVSNRSTNKKDNTTAIKLKIPTLPKSYWKHLPKVSPNFEKSVIANVGNRL